MGEGNSTGEGGALGHVAKCVSCHAEYRFLWSLRKALRTMNVPGHAGRPGGAVARARLP